MIVSVSRDGEILKQVKIQKQMEEGNRMRRRERREDVGRMYGGCGVEEIMPCSYAVDITYIQNTHVYANNDIV